MAIDCCIAVAGSYPSEDFRSEDGRRQATAEEGLPSPLKRKQRAAEEGGDLSLNADG